MSLPTALQSFPRTFRCTTCIRRSLLTSPRLVFPARLPYRGYATDEPPRKKFELPDEYTEEVFNALANNPRIMQSMHNVIEAFHKRGMKLDKEPTVTEMWTIMKDKEIISALEDCYPPLWILDLQQCQNILKNMPWSKEAETWAKEAMDTDPTTSDAAIQSRIKKIRDILKRPDPSSSSSSPPKTIDAGRPTTFEKDTSERELGDDDRVSLGEVQADLRGWWKGNEEQVFHEKLARYKTKMGDELMEGDVYDFWIEEWSRKVKEIAKLGP